MNIFVWILQILLAMHTLIGAVWKFSHSAEETMPSLKALPSEIWIALAIFEILCALGLILPALNDRFKKLAPFAAAGIALEMLLLCGLHLNSGDRTFAPMAYWLVVAALSAFIAYRRRS